ncbi:hypothetical protein ACHAWT_003018 [Skeletonema menzelii]
MPNARGRLPIILHSSVAARVFFSPSTLCDPAERRSNSNDSEISKHPNISVPDNDVTSNSSTAWDKVIEQIMIFQIIKHQ